MTAPLKPSSPGLGSTVIEYPAGAKRQQSAPEPKAAPVHKLDLLKHIPDCMFKRYVIDVAKMTRIPANTSFLVGLGIVSTVTARCFVVSYEERGYLPLGLYILAEHDSGTGKSWMLKTYQSPVFSSVKALVSDWKSRKQAAEAAKEDFYEPFPNFSYDTDVTPEGLDQTLSATNGYFALASAEKGLANSISGASYGAGKTNNDLWLKGCNAEHHGSKRKGRGGYTGDVVGAVVNIAQPGLVQTILTQSDHSGAAERCLMISEESLLGTRKHGREYRHFPNEGDQGAYNRIMQGLTVLATQNQPVEQLPGYRLSREDWDKVYTLQNEVEPHTISGGKYSSQTLKSIVGKVDIQIMKIAANLAVLDECPPGLIPSQWVDSAIGIVRDMLEYTYRLLIELDVIGTNALEDSVIAYLSEKRTATRRQFHQAKHKAKPWSELPKAAAGQAMRDTIDGLIDKGIVGEFEEFDASGKRAAILKLIA
ncbi:DUF3987 domain-containing protein [Thiothrix subterranea]|uniref:DUF3987 domain-containing protein n=1 Tax=Thiothrix subterranea TaxID=2735563 RepID=A0AA51R3Y8_9GAMM|nr:DUF3987 domain-containing protein [Thiothrix subterranea]MDQ5769945.1 DUF3987 domain-containing protein [Thiothrix subterranea]WML86030.1 DUF3987 domain-containing protein [Thiothrix subterranea]